ncbi:hypothetical protein WJX72_004319 [[Myrmecia] bisecta]|uniref:ATP synthase mitochondrial F1 complex assembly factor 2 n=1 Tax=[Myrmecia] bisecta TaxID=41462 RepID=A0AAW1PTL2_9CHLO
MLATLLEPCASNQGTFIATPGFLLIRGPTKPARMPGLAFSSLLPGLRFPLAFQLTCMRTLAGAPLQCAGYATNSDLTAGVSDTRSDGTVLRFYKTVGVRLEEQQGGYQVTLDGRPLKTPARKPLVLPTYALALAVAAEWEWQDARRIRPFTMPLMSLAATAIDQPKPRPLVIQALSQYLQTDSTCCRHEPGPLADRQALIYNPILSWARHKFGADFAVTTSIFGAEHAPAASAQVEQYLHGLDAWRLTAVEALAGACRSVLMGLAVMHGKMGVQDAIAAARLEEAWQVEEWGLVEGGHDIDMADISVRVAAPITFLRLLPPQQSQTKHQQRPGETQHSATPR